MAYCTQIQVQNAAGGPAVLLQLTDLANANAPTIDSTVVDQAIAESDAVINSYVGHRFLVPLSPVPLVIVNLSVAWSVRVLRRNKYNGQPLQDDLDREKTDRDWLALVAKGMVSLGIEPNPTPASEALDISSTRDSTKTISRLRLRGSW